MRRDKMTLAQKLEADRKPKPMRKYTFEVITNPTCLELQLGIAKIERKAVTVKGTSRKDAMQRAGIQ